MAYRYPTYPDPREDIEKAVAWLKGASVVELNYARGHWVALAEWPEWVRAWLAALEHEFPAPDPLPALEGTPKQVAWAENIRRAAIKTTREWWLPRYLEAAEIDRPAVREKIVGVLAKLCCQTSARWWIDNRLSLT